MILQQKSTYEKDTSFQLNEKDTFDIYSYSSFFCSILLIFSWPMFHSILQFNKKQHFYNNVNRYLIKQVHAPDSNTV